MVLLFEEFNERTLKSNIDVYNDFYDFYGEDGENADRSGIVAWEAENSQNLNFKLVSDHINNNSSVLDFGCGIGDLLNYFERENKNIKKYLGVDINENFINLANKTHDNNFKLISNVDSIQGKWDNVCAIGVFTWYIEEDEFIETIHKLCGLANKQVLLTVLYDKDVICDEQYWAETYRYYNEEVFNTLFPELNIDFERIKDTMLVRITK